MTDYKIKAPQKVTSIITEVEVPKTMSKREKLEFLSTLASCLWGPGTMSELKLDQDTDVLVTIKLEGKILE